MIRHRCLGFLLVSLLALPGCGNEMISGTIYRAGAADHFAASGGRDLKTVIIGNPFPEPKSQADAAIVAAMQGHHPGPATRFTTTPGSSSIDVYRIAILFNPPRSTRPADICGDGSNLVSETTGDIRLMAAFCADDLPITAVDAVLMSRSGSADDPVMRRFIANVMRELIPAEDPLAFID